MNAIKRKKLDRQVNLGLIQFRKALEEDEAGYIDSDVNNQLREILQMRGHSLDRVEHGDEYVYWSFYAKALRILADRMEETAESIDS